MFENGKILQNVKIAKDIWKMEIACQLAKNASAGEFIEIGVPEFFLKRPISICEVKEKSLVIIYKVVGQGTKKMTEMKDDIEILGPLGTGFPIKQAGDLGGENKNRVFLIGGGVGVPPLYETAKKYIGQGTEVVVILGFGCKEEVFLEKEFKKLGCKVHISTVDGSYGEKGTVLDVINDLKIKGEVLESKERTGKLDEFVCSCGPLPMLKEIDKIFEKGYLSLEARMGCGIGACMGCVVKDNKGVSHRVCKEGPVFPVGKVVL